MKRTATWAIRKPQQLIPASIAGLLLAYALGSRAIDTGSWWQYFGTLFLTYVSIKLLWRGLVGVKRYIR